jgi:inorganic triphosphatase YgiF
MALLCIDTGEVRTEDGPPVLRDPIHEIELELEAGNVTGLFELAHLPPACHSH